MSFEGFYNRHCLFVRRIIFRMAGDVDLDDLVQETFLKAWKARGSFDGRSSEKTWLAKIGINSAIDSLRKRKDQVLEYDDSSSTSGQGGGQENFGLRDLINKALTDLKEPFKSALVLVVVEGFSTTEAASALDIEEGTVRSRVNRARTILKDSLKEQGENYG